MWILPQVGETAPSRFSTKHLITEILKKIEKGWKIYFTEEETEDKDDHVNWDKSIISSRVSMIEIPDNSCIAKALNLNNDLMLELGSDGIQNVSGSNCVDKGEMKCDYPNCDGILPLEICGYDVWNNKTHHMCQNNFDYEKYGGKFEDTEGVLKRCKQCFLEHMMDNS